MIQISTLVKSINKLSSASSFAIYFLSHIQYKANIVFIVIFNIYV